MSLGSSGASVQEQILVLEPGRAEKNYWADLWRYRELFFILAWRDISVRYKQTIIAVAWAAEGFERMHLLQRGARLLRRSAIVALRCGRQLHPPSRADGPVAHRRCPCRQTDQRPDPIDPTMQEHMTPSPISHPKENAAWACSWKFPTL